MDIKAWLICWYLHPLPPPTTSQENQDGSVEWPKPSIYIVWSCVMSVPHRWFGPTDPLQLCVSSFHVMLFISESSPPSSQLEFLKIHFLLALPIWPTILHVQFNRCSVSGDGSFCIRIQSFKSFWSCLHLKTIGKIKICHFVFHLFEFAAYLRKFNWLRNYRNMPTRYRL